MDTAGVSRRGSFGQGLYAAAVRDRLSDRTVGRAYKARAVDPGSPAKRKDPRAGRGPFDFTG